MKTEIEHFYWVASAYNAPGLPAYHVQAFAVAETMAEVEELGGQARVGRTLTITQAEELGLDLAKIRELIDADLAKRLDAATARVHELELLLSETTDQASP